MKLALDSQTSSSFRTLERIIDHRRSVRRFTSQPIAPGDMQEVLDAGLLAPTSSNLQPFELYWVRSPQKRAALISACLDQSAARKAQELVVCVARWDLWNQTRKEYLAFLQTQPNIPKMVMAYYERFSLAYYGRGPLNLFGHAKRLGLFLIGLTRPIIRFPVSREDMRVWAVKSAALVCENIMLAAAAKGFDSCAMEGHDPLRVGAIVGLKRRHWKRRWDIPMVLAFGYRDPQTGLFGDRWRRDREKLVKET